MVSVTGFDDRETLNRILMYRYLISYEPYDFKGHLDDFPRQSGFTRRGHTCDCCSRAARPSGILSEYGDPLAFRDSSA